MSIFVYERYLSIDEKITSTLGICGKNSTRSPFWGLFWRSREFGSDSESHNYNRENRDFNRESWSKIARVDQLSRLRESSRELIARVPNTVFQIARVYKHTS
jgi:hypothetical protein